MFSTSVSFQVMRVPGIANRYFGGGDHHFAVLSGPGPVWLQSMAMPVLAASLAPYLPQAQAQGQVHHAAEGGVAAGSSATCSSERSPSPRKAGKEMT
jgi:hypothetical protein